MKPVHKFKSFQVDLLERRIIAKPSKILQQMQCHQSLQEGCITGQAGICLSVNWSTDYVRLVAQKIKVPTLT